jgi:hypothetical protein
MLDRLQQALLHRRYSDCRQEVNAWFHFVPLLQTVGLLHTMISLPHSQSVGQIERGLTGLVRQVVPDGSDGVQLSGELQETLWITRMEVTRLDDLL